MREHSRDVYLNKRVESEHEFFGVESTIQLAFDFVSQKYFASPYEHIAHMISSHIASGIVGRQGGSEKTIFHV